MENAPYSPDLPISLEHDSHKIVHHHLLKSFGANYAILKILYGAGAMVCWRMQWWDAELSQSAPCSPGCDSCRDEARQLQDEAVTQSVYF